MKFILVYPERNGIEGDLLDAGHVGDLAALAESVGFDGFALTEHPVPGAKWLASGGHQTLDPIVGLAFAAAATKNIKLLTYLIVLPYRNPFILAKATATLDRLSGGRLLLGVGTGYQKSEFFALGVDLEERNALFDEVMEAMPLAWSGEVFSYKGAHFDARDVVCRPPSAQQPIPVWIGGNSKLTLRRVAAKAQGWMPLGGGEELAKTARSPHLAGLDAMATAIAQVRDSAVDQGRTEHISVVPAYPERNVEIPTKEIERHKDVIGQYASIGVDALTVEVPVNDPAAVREFIQGFGQTYITGA